jgi:3-oxoadipate enol-lactonase
MTDTPYVVSGKRDGPAIVFIHPLGADRSFWDECRLELDHRALCIAFDLRGAGEAPLPPPSWSVARQADDIETLRKELGLERIIVAGCAVGSMPAANYAARYPDRTSSLIMSNPAIQTREAARDMLRQRALAVRENGMDAILPGAVEKAFLGCDDDGRKERYSERFAAQDPEGYALSILSILDADITDDIGQIRCPTLLLACSNDVLLPPEHAEQIHARMPKSELVLVEGAAHFFPYQRPVQFSELVSDFLTRTLPLSSRAN